MSEDPKKKPEDEDQTPYVPASPVKRILAWVGIVYMVAIVLMTLYPFFHGGGYLLGIAPLLVCPGTAGLFAMSIWQMRQKECTVERKAAMVLLACVCAVIFILGLVDGIPVLLGALGANV